ncbi:MAG: ribonuclease Y [Chloroflexi bacterium]|nr:MAG: ribonuclease Y [Chloroflexota bacterium]TMF64000.1 MAG: ribonuclease Y [Chloroflexota bacterium]TMG38057.1 MAG: ribonuclease Y [Chloroflexota bacterium]
MPDILVVGLVALVAGLVGFAIALLLRRSFALASETAARANSERLVAEARAKQKEIILEAKDEALKVAKAAETENRERRAELQRFESRLDKKDEQLDQKVAQVEERDRRLGEREAEVDAERTKTVQIQEEQRTELARVASLTMDEARALLLQRVEEEVRDLTNRKVRELEAEARERADERARDIITMALQRYAAEHTAEHSVTVVALPSDDMKGRIIGREGRNIRTLETLTGVDLVIDDTPEAVVVSGFDPIRREIAKRALERLLVDGRIHPARIEEMVAKARTEIDQVMKEAAEAAVYEVGIGGLHPDLVKLLGRLHFRTSYGQNVLRHSIEVAHVAGMLASETGYDPQTMKRAGLLHDIGKAIDHEVEGPHTVIGGELLKRYGFPQNVIDGVVGHHGDVEPVTMVGTLISAADAISAARPGARSEIVSNYIQRLQELESVANSFEGVEKSFAIQAGREVRVVVKPDKLDDLQTARLSRDIAQKIQETMQYPGQIKVTVIRETRAVEYAK